MSYTTLDLGLQLTLPTNGTTNWGTTLYNTTWTKISQHGHTGSGDGTPIATGAINNYAITTIKLSKNVGNTQASTLTPSGTTQTIDFNNGVIQILDVGSASGDVTLTLSNPLSGSRYWMYITQGATLRDIIWPVAVKWPQSQKLIVSGVNKTDRVMLYYTGSVYYAEWELDYV